MMKKGTIVTYSEISGFGYIIDDEKDEYCFYTKDIFEKNDSLIKGNSVQFEIYKGAGTRAVNVIKA